MKMIFQLAGVLLLIGLATSLKDPVCDIKPAPIMVNYAYQYLDARCRPDTEYPAVPAITVTIPTNDVALSVLEQSVNVGPQYRFSATYFGTTLGFFINAINGTASAGSCFWAFYILVPGSTQPVKPTLGVSSFIIPSSGYSVYMRYEMSEGDLVDLPQPNVTACDVGVITVNYAYQYPDTNCPLAENYPVVLPITVTIPTNGTALNVMQESTNVGRQYRFSATYFGTTLGYFIDSINGTSSNLTANCFWFFYVLEPGSVSPVLASVGVSNFYIPRSGYSIFMRYEKSPEREDDTSSAVGVSTSFILLVMLVAAALATPYLH